MNLKGRKISQYRIRTLDRDQQIILPLRSEILSVMVINNVIYVYVAEECNDDSQKETITFKLIRTGDIVDIDAPTAVFLGTVQILWREDDLALHVFYG